MCIQALIMLISALGILADGAMAPRSPVHATEALARVSREHALEGLERLYAGPARFVAREMVAARRAELELLDAVEARWGVQIAESLPALDSAPYPTRFEAVEIRGVTRRGNEASVLARFTLEDGRRVTRMVGTRRGPDGGWRVVSFAGHPIVVAADASVACRRWRAVAAAQSATARAVAAGELSAAEEIVGLRARRLLEASRGLPPITRARRIRAH